MVYDYLGVRFSLEADLKIAPRLAGFGGARLEFPHIALDFEYSKEGFSLTNLAPHERTFLVDLTGLAGHENANAQTVSLVANATHVFPPA